RGQPTCPRRPARQHGVPAAGRLPCGRRRVVRARCGATDIRDGAPHTSSTVPEKKVPSAAGREYRRTIPGRRAMAGSSVSADDLSRLRDALDVIRPERAMSPEQAMSEVLRLVRELVGCDSAQFHEHDSLQFHMPYLQYVDDVEAFVASPEQLAAED